MKVIKSYYINPAQNGWMVNACTQTVTEKSEGNALGLSAGMVSSNDHRSENYVAATFDEALEIIRKHEAGEFGQDQQAA